MPPTVYHYTKNMAPVIPKEEEQQQPLPDRSRPVPQPRHPKPLLRMLCTDLRQPQTQRLLRLFEPNELLESSVDTVLGLLYPDCHSVQPDDKLPWPATRSITLILDADYGGVAETGGLQLDHDHKELRLNAKWAAEKADAELLHEVRGVIVHEMVHCWQWDGRPHEDAQAPGGLIEGIADWVRLRAGLAPPHWQRVGKKEEGWDGGYERTAFFLEWLEQGYAKDGASGGRCGGQGTVVKVNAHLKGKRYDEEAFWKHCCGRDVKGLWVEYCKWLEERTDGAQEGGMEWEQADGGRVLQSSVGSVGNHDEGREGQQAFGRMTDKKDVNVTGFD